MFRQCRRNQTFPAGSGLVVDSAFKFMMDHVRRQHHNGAGAVGIVKHYVLGKFMARLASAVPGSDTESSWPKVDVGRFTLKLRAGTPQEVGPELRAALQSVVGGLGAFSVEQYGSIRERGMHWRASHCTERRDQRLVRAQLGRGPDCALCPPQGRYVLVWSGAKRTYLLITSIALLTAESTGARRLLLAGRQLHAVSTTHFVLAQLLSSVSAVELDSSCSLEQVSACPVNGSGLMKICPQFTLLCPTATSPSTA
jgi:hypothetical protein